MRTDLTLAEAIVALAALLPEPKIRTVRLDDALGMVLAAPLAARQDHPSVDDSAMDGFAVHLADTLSATREEPAYLNLVGESAAGAAFPGAVQAGQAVRVFTGAAVPVGADAVIRVEDTHQEGHVVRVFEPANPGDIRRRAQDLEAGRVYLRPGRRLGPAEIALAAAMGHASLSAFKAPSIHVISSGDELVAPGGAPTPGSVFESNSYGLAALARRAGWAAERRPSLTDSLDATRVALGAADGADFIVTSGGVSMGERDSIRILLEGEGSVAFRRVKIRPGGPVLCGRWRDRLVVGLPGNPVSALVVFQVLVLPAWWARVGGEGPANLTLPARAAAHLNGTVGRLTFARVALNFEGDELLASPVSNQSSGVLRSLAESQALAVIPETGRVELGGGVKVILPLR